MYTHCVSLPNFFSLSFLHSWNFHFIIWRSLRVVWLSVFQKYQKYQILEFFEQQVRSIKCYWSTFSHGNTNNHSISDAMWLYPSIPCVRISVVNNYVNLEVQCCMSLKINEHIFVTFDSKKRKGTILQSFQWCNGNSTLFVNVIWNVYNF